jgi:hypothetical protein
VARHPKVADVEDAAFKKEVARLEVAVEHPVTVHVREGAQQLQQQALDLRLREGLRHRAHQRLGAVFEQGGWDGMGAERGAPCFKREDGTGWARSEARRVLKGRMGRDGRGARRAVF